MCLRVCTYVCKINRKLISLQSVFLTTMMMTMRMNKSISRYIGNGKNGYIFFFVCAHYLIAFQNCNTVPIAEKYAIAIL